MEPLRSVVTVGDDDEPPVAGHEDFAEGDMDKSAKEVITIAGYEEALDDEMLAHKVLAYVALAMSMYDKAINVVCV